MKIAFFSIKEWEKEVLQKQLPSVKCSFFPEKISLKNIEQVKDCQIISVLTDSVVDKEVIELLPELKMISARSTGFDHIDLEEAKKRKIVVCNVPTYGENTVAEHTFGLLLNLSRKIYQSIQKVRQRGFALDDECGFDLKGKTLGIVGTGHIGQHVARIANGFEMKVIAFDTKPDKKLAKQFNIEYVLLEDLLKRADIITLHVPYNTHTHHLINYQNMKLVKRGAYIINTSRGGVLETDALVKALNDGTLAGAGLDVLEGEHQMSEERERLFDKNMTNADYKILLEDHMLMERDNVIITPHNAFNSREALERILEATVENVQGFIKNKPVNIAG